MDIFACGIQNKTFIKIYSAHKITWSNPVWRPKETKKVHHMMGSNQMIHFFGILNYFPKITL